MEKTLQFKELLAQWIIFENTPIEFALLDGKSGKMIKVNRAWSRSLGFNTQDLEGKDFASIVATDDFSFDRFRTQCTRNATIEGLKLKLLHKDGSIIDVLLNASKPDDYFQCTFLNITKQNRLAEERIRMIRDLEQALQEIKMLRSFLPICSSCKRIKTDKGEWVVIETYFRDRIGVEFSHGICPECIRKLYPEFAPPD